MKQLLKYYLISFLILILSYSINFFQSFINTVGVERIAQIDNIFLLIYPLVITHFMIRNYKSANKLKYLNKLLILIAHIMFLTIMMIVIGLLDLANSTQYMNPGEKELGVIGLSTIYGVMVMTMGLITIIFAKQKIQNR